MRAVAESMAEHVGSGPDVARLGRRPGVRHVPLHRDEPHRAGWRDAARRRRRRGDRPADAPQAGILTAMAAKEHAALVERGDAGWPPVRV